MRALFSVNREQVLRNDLADPKIIDEFFAHCYTPCGCAPMGARKWLENTHFDVRIGGGPRGAL
jgi:hypothetical protein